MVTVTTTAVRFFSSKTLKGAQPIPLLITLFIGAILWFCPHPEGLSDQAWHLFSIFVATIVGIITRPLPVAPVVLIGMLAALLTKTLTFTQVFMSYSSENIWLIVFSFFIAKSFIKTGLAERISYIFIGAFGKRTLGLAYSIIFSELLMSPFIPSLIARSGGIIFPIVMGLIKRQEEPEDLVSREAQNGFLVSTAFQGSIIASSMFLTAMAANPIVAQIAKDFNITISWGLWALAAFVPGIISLLLLPLVVYKLVPPQIKATPNAPILAKERLMAMGKLTSAELIMMGTFATVLFLWVFGNHWGINSALAAMLGLVILLVVGVIHWKDCLHETTAWDTLFWFGALVAMSSQLKNLGLFDWFSHSMVGVTSHMHWYLGSFFLAIIYFYCHYLFASNVAHATAMFAAFLGAAIQIGTPPLLAALVFSFLSSLYGGLTHYSSTTAPIFYGAHQVRMTTWWKVGLITSLITLSIWFTIGNLWWKLLKIW